jgi:hypothetical protein
LLALPAFAWSSLLRLFVDNRGDVTCFDGRESMACNRQRQEANRTQVAVSRDFNMACGTVLKYDEEIACVDDD